MTEDLQAVHAGDDPARGQIARGLEDDPRDGEEGGELKRLVPGPQDDEHAHETIAIAVHRRQPTGFGEKDRRAER